MMDLTYKGKQVTVRDLAVLCQHPFIEVGLPNKMCKCTYKPKYLSNARSLIDYLLFGRGVCGVLPEYFNWLRKEAKTNILQGQQLLWLIGAGKLNKNNYRESVIDRVQRLVEYMFPEISKAHSRIVVKFALMNLNISVYHKIYIEYADDCKKIPWYHRNNINAFKVNVLTEIGFTEREYGIMARAGLTDSTTLALLGNYIHNYITDAVIALYPDAATYDYAHEDISIDDVREMNITSCVM